MNFLKTNRKWLFLIIVFLPLSAFSYDESGPNTTVNYVYTDKNGGIYVQFASGGMPGCFADRGGYVNTESEQGKSQLFAGLLAAKATGETVTVLYDYTGNTSGWGMCYIHGVYFK